MITNKESLSSALLEAMSSFAENARTTTNGTLTVEAKIVEVVDKGKGIYKVWYQGSIFEATAANTNITYSIDDIVLIVVPDGDFDKKKIILAPVVTNTSNYVEDQEITSYIKYGRNMLEGIANNIAMPAIAGSSNPDPIPVVDSSTNTDLYHKLKLLNSKDTNNFCLNCNIKTEIPKNRRAQGNYGLTWETTEKDKAIVFDKANILGDSYQLSFETPQTLFLNETQLPLVLKENKMQAFSKEFPAYEEDEDINEIFINDIGFYPAYKLTEADKRGYFLFLNAENGNIFIDDENNKKIIPQLYLNGKTTDINGFDCYWFKENYSVSLSKEEEDITTGSNTDVNSKYNEYGGPGWELLNNFTDISLTDGSTKNVEYILNNYELEVSKPYFSTKYKCVLVQNDKEVVSQIINFYNLNKVYNNLIIETSTVDGKYSAAEGWARIKVTYFDPDVTNLYGVIPTLIPHFQSAVQDKEKFEVIQNDVKKVEYTYIEYNHPERQEVDAEAVEMYFQVTLPEKGQKDIITCSLELGSSSGGSFIGSTSTSIETRASNNYIIKFNDSSKSYKYDSYGNSPFLANYDGGIEKVTNVTEKIIASVYNIDNGETLVQLNKNNLGLLSWIWKVPVDSLIELDAKSEYEIENGYYIIKYNNDPEEVNTICLKYTIANMFRAIETSQDVLLEVIIDDGSDIVPIQIESTVKFNFSKDEASKTNGEKYTGLLEPATINVVRLHNGDNDLYFLNDDGSSLSSSITLTPSLFCNGEIKNNIENQLSIVDKNYELGDSYLNSSYFQIQPNSLELELVSPNNNSEDNVHIGAVIKDIISIPEHYTDINFENVVAYAFTKFFDMKDLNNNVLHPFNLLQGGFDKITYAKDGTNPKYNNAPLYIFKDKKHSYYDFDTLIKDYFNVIVSASDNIKVDYDDTNILKVRPITSFENGENKNYIYLSLNLIASQSKIQSEIDKYNNLHNAKNKEFIELRDGLLFALNDLLDNLAPNYDLLKQDVIKYDGNFFNFKSGYYPLIDNAQIRIQEIINYINQYYNYFIDKFDVDTFLDTLNNYNTQFSTNKGYLSLLGGDPYFWGTAEGVRTFLNAFNPSEEPDNPNPYYIDLEIEETSSLITGLKDLVEKYNYYMMTDYCTLSQKIYEETNPESYVVEFYNFDQSRLYNFLFEFDQSNPDTKNEQWQRLMGLDVDHHVEELENFYQYFSNVFNALMPYISDIVGDPSNNTAAFVYNSFDVDSYINNILKRIKGIIDINLRPMVYKLSAAINEAEEEVVKYENLYNYFNTLENYRGFPIQITKAIAVTYDTFGMSHIESWDGTKIEMGNHYLLAPSIGAGIKDIYKEDHNSFTGVVMGVEQSFERDNDTGEINKNNLVGLLGYHQDERTFFLNSRDGSAIFGKEGIGQIIVDPREGYLNGAIYNYGYWDNLSYDKDGKPYPLEWNGQGNRPENSRYHSFENGGMLLNFANNPFIHFGTANGKIYSGDHTDLAVAKPGFYLSHDGLSIGDKVCIDANGVMKLGLNAVDEQGNEHWTIDGSEDKSYITWGGSYDTPRFKDEGNTSAGEPEPPTQIKPSVYMGTDGISLGHKRFWVTPQGELHAENATITGDITANTGNIGNWKIVDGKIVSQNTKIELNAIGDADGAFIKGTNDTGTQVWKLSENGKFYANLGEIGGWIIGPNTLSSSNNAKIQLNSNGSLSGGKDANHKWTLDSNGILTAKGFTINCDSWYYYEGYTHDTFKFYSDVMVQEEFPHSYDPATFTLDYFPPKITRLQIERDLNLEWWKEEEDPRTGEYYIAHYPGTLNYGYLRPEYIYPVPRSHYDGDPLDPDDPDNPNSVFKSLQVDEHTLYYNSVTFGGGFGTQNEYGYPKGFYDPTLVYSTGIFAAKQFSTFIPSYYENAQTLESKPYLMAGAPGDVVVNSSTHDRWYVDNVVDRQIITDLRYNNDLGVYQYKSRACSVANGIIVKWSSKSNWVSISSTSGALPKVKYYHGEMEPGEFSIDFTLPDWATGMTNTILTVSPIKNGAVTFLKWEFVNNDSSTVRLHFSDFTSNMIYWKIETFTNS